MPGARVVEAAGDGRLEELSVGVGGREERAVAATAAFVFIGAAPQHRVARRRGARRDEAGFILSGTGRSAREASRRWRLRARRPSRSRRACRGSSWPATSGDASIKRVASAVGEGAMAVRFVHQYLGRLWWWPVTEDRPREVPVWRA